MAENVTSTRGKPVEDKANCSPFDLGVLFEELRQFSDQRKFELINNVWRPGSTFLFPKTKEAEIEDLICLGFRISLGSFIQDIWMGLSAFRVFFLPDNVDVTPQS